MIGRLTRDDALSGLLAEYPELSDWGIEVERQFPAGQDRISNAFFIRCQSNRARLKQFVAKSSPPHAENSAGLVTEWRALKMALAGGVPAPPLLFPEHAPQGFLLLEFLEGADAETAIDSGVNPAAVFGLLGTSLKQLHAVQAPYFGGISDEREQRWKDVMTARFEPRLASLKEFLDPDLYRSLATGIDHALPALEMETDGPRLIHRDVYLSNFIISEDRKKAKILDFGMAYFGRPMYDLSKLYILDLYRYPEARDSFLDGYLGDSPAPDTYKPLLKLYLFAELVGMIRFFRAQGQKAAYAHAVTVLGELTSNKGRIVELLH